MTEKTVLSCKNTDIEIAYDYKQGGEESILFIHGLGACRECFKDVLSFPGYENYTIVIPDLPGFGDSSKLLSVGILFSLFRYWVLSLMGIPFMHKLFLANKGK